ncbi:MAG TPA: hypothetical protein VFW11_20185 [Cyclobacteriaceae bacterium]|nr:hypothetical protein [Cyclobacteriaceae bacterium]
MTPHFTSLPPAIYSDSFAIILQTVTLHLSARAYLLLREECPMAIPYLQKVKNNKRYTFTGPVVSYAGIGKFVMGRLDEIEIVGPVGWNKLRMIYSIKT